MKTEWFSQTNVQPGDKARIIDTVNGTAGYCYGKIVTVVELSKGYSRYENPLFPDAVRTGWHNELGTIWTVTGDVLQDEYGGISGYVDVPDRWLEKIEPEDLPSETTETKELENV